jgi:hypothetical protein
MTNSSLQTASRLLLDYWLVINRRRTPRSAANNATGMLRVLDDVEIEHVTDQAITVLSETQVPRGERMILWAPAADGGELPLRVRAVQRQAVLTSAHLRHRVRFDVDAIGMTDPGAARPAPGASHTRRIGGIVREVPIRLLDIGAGGCLIGSPVRIAEGAVGWLSVNGQNARYDEVVRVCRSEWRTERFWRWIAGVEFLTLEPPSAGSLRRNVALFTKPCVEAHERS